MADLSNERSHWGDHEPRDLLRVAVILDEEAALKLFFDASLKPSRASFNAKVLRGYLHVPAMLEPFAVAWRVGGAKGLISHFRDTPVELLNMLGWTADELEKATFDLGRVIDGGARAEMFETAVQQNRRAAGGMAGWESLSDSSDEALTEAAPLGSWVSGERTAVTRGAHELGQVIADRYELNAILGEGGMGRVYSAYDRVREGDVALKMVSFDKGDRLQLEARFRREIEVLTQLNGSAFVELFDHAIRPDCAYLAMELLEGETLQTRLTRQGRLTPIAALELLRGMARGLREAHDMSLVHRDIKPGNIFFATSEAGETVRLLDFGIAKDLWQSSGAAKLTRAGTLLGSPHYVSPEQAQSREVDERSDLWSVAVVLYRCLTGHRAFDGPPSTLILRILTERAVAPSRIVPSLSASVDAFFDKALAKRPADRFQDVWSLVQGFASAIGESASPSMPATDASAHLAHSPALGPDHPSAPTQIAEESYESYAAQVSNEGRASYNQTVEIAAPLLTGHAPSRPPPSGEAGPARPFSESPWQSPATDPIAPAPKGHPAVIVASFVIVLLGALLVGAYFLWAVTRS